MVDLEAQVADLSAQVAQLVMVNQDLRTQEEILQQQIANTEQQLAEMLSHQVSRYKSGGCFADCILIIVQTAGHVCGCWCGLFVTA